MTFPAEVLSRPAASQNWPATAPEELARRFFRPGARSPSNPAGVNGWALLVADWPCRQSKVTGEEPGRTFVNRA